MLILSKPFYCLTRIVYLNKMIANAPLFNGGTTMLWVIVNTTKVFLVVFTGQNQKIPPQNIIVSLNATSIKVIV